LAWSSGTRKYISQMNKQTTQRQFTTKFLRSLDELAHLNTEWENCRKRQPRPCLDLHTRAFVTLSDPARTNSFRAVTIYQGGEMTGAAPLVIRDHWRWKWNLSQLGLRRPLAQFDLRLAEFCGPDFTGMLDEEAARHLLTATIRTCEDCDVIRFNQLSTHSVLGRSLLKEPSSRKGWWLWRRKQNEARWLIRIGGTFEDYLTKFPGKKRRYLMWEVRQLENHFFRQLRLTRISGSGEVGPFVKAAQKISEQSWQGTNHTVDQTSKLVDYANNGWLQCYLLLGAEQPLAYLMGRQSNGVYIADESAFDNTLANFFTGENTVAEAY
jgi:hypothetical protein